MKTHKLSTLWMIALLAVVLQGCSLNSSVDLRQAEQQVQTVDEKLALAKVTIDQLNAQLEEAKRILDATGDANAAKAVAVLSSAVVQAKLAIPRLEEASAVAHDSLAKLKEQGDTAPLWKVLGTVALVALPKVLTFIPGIGPLAAPIANIISSIGWAFMATKKQKEEDELAAAKAAALEHQVRFGNELLKLVPKSESGPIKDTTRAALTDEGLHDVVHGVVRKVEREDGKESKLPAEPAA